MHRNGYLYFIDVNKKVNRGVSYNSSPSIIYSTTDARALFSHNDRAYLATNSGQILRLNSGNTAFEAYYTPLNPINIIWIGAYRGYIVIFAKTDNGTTVLHKLTNAPELLTITEIDTGSRLFYRNTAQPGDKLFALYKDAIYFSPGRTENVDGTHTINIFTFNGSSVEHITQIPDSITTPAFAGFLVWRNKLIFYQLRGTEAENTFKLLVRDQFTTLPSLTPNPQGAAPAIASILGNLYVRTENAYKEGYYTLGNDNLQNGHLITSYLDLKYPNQQKYLNKITVLTDQAQENLSTVIKYRINDELAWTTLTTATNTRYASAQPASPTRFYTIQIRVDINDGSANKHNVRILSVSLQCTVGDK